MELILPMYDTHPYFSLKNLGKNVCIIHGKNGNLEMVYKTIHLKLKSDNFSTNICMLYNISV